MNEQPTAVVLALGANIGDCQNNIKKALQLLADAGLENIKLSSFYHNKAQGCAEGTADFTNAVALADCPFGASELLTLCQKTEAALGREPEHGKNTSRTIDIDIILFGSQRIRLPKLSIPHPRAHLRDFVLKPLSELAPKLVTTIKTMADCR